MIRDNAWPLTAMMAPPETLDAAIGRVAEFGGDWGLMGLTGVIFRDANQLQKALAESGYHARQKVILDSGRVRSIDLAVEGIAGMAGDGWEYRMIVTEISGQWARVDNCKMTKASPEADPERVAEIKALMSEQ